MKKGMIIAALCCIGLFMIGCGNKKSDTDTVDNSAANTSEGAKEEPKNTKKEAVNISLMLWDEVQAPIIQESIDKFNELHTGQIFASIEQVPWDTYWTKLDASMAAEKAADVVWMNVYLPKYVSADLVKPLDDYIAKDNLDMGQYIEGRVNAYNVNEKQFALPKGLDTVYVAYNKEIFDRYGVEYPKNGWTWDDMCKIAEDLKGKISAAKGTEYPIVMELDGQPSWLNFVYQNGGYYISEDGKTTGMAEDASVEAIQKMVDLMNNQLMAPYNVLSETKGTDLFISGQGAIVFVGSWKASVLEESSLGQAGSIGLVQMPLLNGSNASNLGGLGYCLAASSKNPDAAWELIKYITSYDSLYNEAVNGIDIPAHKESQKGYIKNFNNIDAQIILDASVTGFPYPSNGNFDWTSYVDDSVQEALSQLKPVKEALEGGAAKAQKILDDLYKQ